MAIQINKTLLTDEGFEVVNPWCWVNQFLVQDNWANLSYYKSKADFKAGFQALNIRSLPARVSTDLTNAEFWGANLAETFTQKCIDEIEAVTGPDTCTIDKTNPYEVSEKKENLGDPKANLL